MSWRRIWKVARVVWVAAGLLATLWLLDSFRAKGVSPALLESDARVVVEDGDEAILLTPAGEAAPVGLLFFPGGGVEPRAYVPLLRPIAERGYPVALVKLPLRFAPFESHRREAAARARRVAARPGAPSRWVVAGHSKGGKIAAELVQAGFQPLAALVLFATSHPRDLDLSRLEVPVTKIYGSEDGVATVDDVLATRARLPAHTRWVELAGANHAQFGHYGPQLLDGTATLGREAQQARAREELLAALRAGPRPPG